jgi:alkylated DNA repair protein alkB family protein 1
LDRRYYKDVLGDFPPELASLVKNLASAVGESLIPEAAIVNYYPQGSTMGGHLDDAELALERPIVSISIGCPAVFLIGGRTRSKRPTAILLRSGDVLVMSRESRLCYHGVPLILPLEAASDSPLLGHILASSSCRSDPLNQYLSKNRININVRQVTDSSCSWVS